MLFARAISQGYRYHCPDVFSCPVYVDGEISGPERPIELTAVPASSAAISAPALEAAAIELEAAPLGEVTPAQPPRLRTLDGR